MATEVDEMTMEPSHPGGLLRETVLPALGMTVKDVAAHLGVSRAALSELVNEKRSVRRRKTARAARTSAARMPRRRMDGRGR